ncbi:MAG TPA: M15 family metallopeptidase, partial [Acidimicrobiales bacterium]|nr:M15 family metallopeptidase [Acidimicrobiales bacterium]
RPDWLGTRPLPLGPDGFGEVQPTPAELRDRRLATPDILAPPPDATFVATVEPVPDEVADRSTWDPACPVGLGDLRYVTVSFWGFDGRPHRGELLLHAEVADDVVAVFERLHRERFPVEEIRITRADELDAHPTGDGNNTGAFVCRRSRSTTSWSEHAYGRAVDINPFHNPFVKGDVVLPELASAYADRSEVRPGMIVAGDVVTAAFAELGWGWGGAWRSSKDYMHFSVNGR